MMNRISLAATLSVLVAVTLSACSGGGSKACLQGGQTNAQAKLDGMKVEMYATADVESGVVMVDYHPVWGTVMNLNLDISKVECDHHLFFSIIGPAVGQFSVGSVTEGTFHGVYDGDYGTDSFTGESTLSITAYDETRISGTFKVLLEDGTTFSSGSFTNVPIR